MITVLVRSSLIRSDGRRSYQAHSRCKVLISCAFELFLESFERNAVILVLAGAGTLGRCKVVISVSFLLVLRTLARIWLDNLDLRGIHGLANS
jgi:hypothetical protein